MCQSVTVALSDVQLSVSERGTGRKVKLVFADFQVHRRNDAVVDCLAGTNRAFCNHHAGMLPRLDISAVLFAEWLPDNLLGFNHRRRYSAFRQALRGSPHQPKYHKIVLCLSGQDAAFRAK